MNVRFHPLAVEDLKDIYRSTANRWGVDQADFYLGQLHEAADALIDHPRKGKAFEQYRCVPSGAHLVFYEIAGQDINIVRVLHNRMNLPAHLRGDESDLNE